ncbi:hypothetical protein BLOT_003090 [Blomia tropicalis]|nr:hypothetical protein BLOT_003090 [Blomia tropicalis]
MNVVHKGNKAVDCGLTKTASETSFPIYQKNENRQTDSIEEGGGDANCKIASPPLSTPLYR